MKKAFKRITMTALLFLAIGTLAGCGKKQIDVMEGIELEFDGVNGYGTVRIADDSVWEEAALEAAGLNEEMDSDDEAKAIHAIQGVFAIESAVKYEISPKDNLSNGDEVTVSVKVNNESLEKYKIELTGKEKKFKVEGLKEVEKIDLFAGVEVKFEGLSPYVKAAVSTQNADNVISVRYTIDKNQNLKIGDTVVVTAEFDAEKLLKQGYIAEADTKEFVLSECDRYVTELADIPSEKVDKMNKQFEDAFRARVANGWKNKDSLKSIEYIGAYLLTEKEGFNGGTKNMYYGVYRISVSTDEQEFSYYSYCQFKDIIILKDGTCSVDLTQYKMPSGASFFSSGETFKKDNLTYEGYEELDSLFNNCVTKSIENYEYESSVKE